MSLIRKLVLTGLALAAIGALWQPHTTAQEPSTTGFITIFDHQKLGASFAKALSNAGSDVVWSHQSGDATYSVSTHSRGTVKAACKPEGCSHKDFTAVVYVVSGAATLIVGGTNHSAPPDKFGGLPVQAGETHRVSKGDMYLVPPDTIHWYKDVEEPFSYIEVPVH
jgi:mannose-6-phosphate isomerase-like protein (cupin superfamily)